MPLPLTRSLDVFTNIPNPYNYYFFEELFARTNLRVRYDAVPAQEGRPWDLPIRSFEVVRRFGWTDVRRRRKSQVDLTIISGGYASARQLAVLLSRPCWFWGERLRGQSIERQLLRRTALARCEAVLAVGSWAVPTYRRVVKAGTPIHVLPYVTNVFAPADAPRAERYTVGYVGSLVERKGVDRLIHALAAMPTRRRPMLEIAGDGPERERLVGLARGLNVDVCWLGEIRPEDLPTVGVHWWVQVVPSRYDGWAVVVNEALGKGVPVIASDQVGAAHDLVRPTLTGRIFSDQAQLVAALDEFGDIDVSRAYGRRGRILAEGLAASRAADWLVDLADSRPADSRSFVDDAWTSAGVRF